MPSQVPDIRYAKSGDVHIAYAVLGDGPIDLVFVHGFIGNLQVELESPYYSPFHERLSSFSRLITFDRRGSGLSDRMREAPTLETRMDDLRAVLDAVGSEHAVLFGAFEAASMCVLYAATYPERTLGLVLYNPVVKGTADGTYPWAASPAEWRDHIQETVDTWGTVEAMRDYVRFVAPSRLDDAAFVDELVRLQRLSVSPGAARVLRRMEMEIDIRDVLPAIGAPTMVVTAPQWAEEMEHIASRIPGAQLVKVEAREFLIFQGEKLWSDVERFVTTLRAARERDTVLATVLFTDIVGSTEKTAELGDRAWAEVVARHHALVRRQLDRFRGRELDTAGDGFFATFDGPIRAIRCARMVATSMHDLGLEVRAGLHTGECEVVGDKLGGIAVSIGARVAARASPGEVLVTSTVKDLVAGSGLSFEDRGTAELKGVPGEWRLYAVADAAA
jgi:class 3 adenylate cyclase